MSALQPRFVRASPEIVEIVETYRCEQELSRSPSLVMVEGEKRGAIRVVVALPGVRAFEGEGRTGGEAGWGDLGGDSLLFGHLLLAGSERTDIDRALPGMSRFGAVPMLLPGERRPPEDGGCRAASFEVDYRPQLPDIPPIEVRMELRDSDAAAGEWVDLSSRDAQEDPRVVKDLMTKRPGRGCGLLLEIEIRLSLPRQLVAAAPRKPGVTARVELGWPTVPAPESVSLLQRREVDEEWKIDREPVVFDAVQRRLRLPEIELKRSAKGSGGTDGDSESFGSGARFLVIDRAEDLASEAALEAFVEVEVSDLLLSGLQARVYRADGSIDEERPGVHETRVESRVTLILDDAVKRWRRSPVQHLHFEHVILDEMRIQDVQAALEDMGFRVSSPAGVSAPARHLLVGKRSEGAKTLCLWVYLQGNPSTAQRRTELAGGQTFITEVESGDLEVYVRGQLDGDPGPVLDGIHGLHERLRHQFLVATDRR